MLFLAKDGSQEPLESQKRRIWLRDSHGEGLRRRHHFCFWFYPTWVGNRECFRLLHRSLVERFLRRLFRPFDNVLGRHDGDRFQDGRLLHGFRFRLRLRRSRPRHQFEMRTPRWFCRALRGGLRLRGQPSIG